MPDDESFNHLSPFEKVEFFRRRAEEYERSIVNLQNAEWRVTIEIFVGYVAIAIAYFQIISAHQRGAALGAFLGGVILVGILWAVHLWFNLHVQIRLHWCRNLQTSLIAKMYSTFGDVNELDLKSSRRLRCWYAFVGQLVLSTATAAALIVYLSLSFANS
jgi:hypothetical protein